MRAHFTRLKEGFPFLIIHVILSTFSSAFVPLYFRSLDLSLYHIVLMPAIATLWSIILALAIRKFELRSYLAAGFVLSSIMILSLTFLDALTALIVYSLFWGSTFVVFWIPLNTLFYRNSKKNTNAIDSSIYYVSSGIIAILMPPVGAYFISQFGYNLLFTLTSVLYLFSALYAFMTIKKELIVSFARDSIRKFKRLKLITASEGALHFFTVSVIPIYTLLFISTEKNFGMFLSYLGLIGFIIAIVLSRNSDKSQRRIGYITPLLILMALSTVSLIVANQVSIWIILVAIYTILYNISNPLRLAISMDVKDVNLSFWKAREIWLNAGRFVLLSLTVVLFFFELYWAVFVMYALLMVLYPMLVKYKLKELN